MEHDDPYYSATGTWSTLIGHPINILLLGVIFYLLLLILRMTIFPQKREAIAIVEEAVRFRSYTPEELARFDLVLEDRLYLAVKGKVYNVTSAASFYGPGGMYSIFAGRDASRGLAKNSFDPSMVRGPLEPIDPLTDLTTEEQQSLDEWALFFANKYPHIGKLVSANERETEQAAAKAPSKHE